jgi:hypothetical protein
MVRCHHDPLIFASLPLLVVSAYFVHVTHTHTYHVDEKTLCGHITKEVGMCELRASRRAASVA